MGNQRVVIEVDATTLKAENIVEIINIAKQRGASYEIAMRSTNGGLRGLTVGFDSRDYKFSKRIPNGYLGTLQAAKVLNVSVEEVASDCRFGGVFNGTVGGGMGRPWAIPEAEVRRVLELRKAKENRA